MSEDITRIEGEIKDYLEKALEFLSNGLEGFENTLEKAIPQEAQDPLKDAIMPEEELDYIFSEIEITKKSIMEMIDSSGKIAIETVGIIILSIDCLAQVTGKVRNEVFDIFNRVKEEDISDSLSDAEREFYACDLNVVKSIWALENVIIGLKNIDWFRLSKEDTEERDERIKLGSPLVPHSHYIFEPKPYSEVGRYRIAFSDYGPSNPL